VKDRKPRRPAPSRPRKLPVRPAPKVLHRRTGPLHVEIVVVGREILRGATADVTSRFLAAELSGRGALVHRIAVVDDSERAVESAVSEALSRGAHLVVTTGGLGPTADDRTMLGISDALRLPLALSSPALDMVEASYRRLKGEGKTASAALTAQREKMAALPVGSEPLVNTAGVAPGVLMRTTGGGAVLCLPGVPEEARSVFLEAVDRLGDLFPRGCRATRELEAPTSDESTLRAILDRVSEEHPLVWIKSHTEGFARRGARVRVTFETFAATPREAEHLVETAMQRLLGLAGER